MIAIDVRGIAPLLASSRRARSIFTRTVWQSLKRSMRKPITRRRKMTRMQPMVQAILRTPWGKRKENRVTRRVKQYGPKIEGNTVNAGIGMFGYAAGVRGAGDHGARIIQHIIPTRGGVIRHPGAAISPQITGGRTWAGEDTEILRQLEIDIHAMIEKVYGL